MTATGVVGPVGAEVVSVAAVPVVVCDDFDVAVEWIVGAADDITATGSMVIRFVNAYTLALTDKYADYRAMLTVSGVNFPDGTPVAWYATRASVGAHHAMQIRHRGPDVFVSCLDHGRGTGVRHFFLGSTEENLAQMIANARREFPGVEVAGWWAPPMVDDVSLIVDESIRRIEEANPSVVWVGIGTPKQDVLANMLATRSTNTYVCVGAALDFFAGAVRQAPKWIQNSAMEWLFRFACEPRRLWRRYLIDSGRFIVAAERHRHRRPSRGVLRGRSSR